MSFYGGSVDELVNCARRHSIEVVYHYDYDPSGWTAFFPGAPGFLSQPFFERFADGVAAGEELIARIGAVVTNAHSGQD